MSINAPELLKGIIAASGDKNDIPLAAQAAGFASFAEGFGTVNGVPLPSGGIAPKREDINGFLNLLSQHIWWIQSGGLYVWSNALDYNVPSMVVGSDGNAYRALLASGPGTGAGYKDPTTQPTYWQPFAQIATLAQALAGTSTVLGMSPADVAAVILSESGSSVAAGGTADALTGTLVSGLTALTNGMDVFIRAASANATTTPTFTLTLGSTSTGAIVIVKGANAALTAGDIAGAGHWLELTYDSTLTKWVLRNPAHGVTAVTAATVDEFYLDGGAMTPTITAGASLAVVEDATNHLTRNVMSFQGVTANTSAAFNFKLPDNWDGGTIKCKVVWTPSAGASGSQNVRFSLAGLAASDGDALDQALGSAVTMDDTVIAAGDQQTTPASAALTFANTPAVGDYLRLVLTRIYNYGGSPMTVAAQVLGVQLQYGITGNIAAW